jgi:transposase
VDIPLFDEQQAPVPTPGERRERVAQSAAPRYQRPNRAQVELRPCHLEALIPQDHPVRTVWAFVTGIDLSPLYQRIRALEGGAGRPPIDPAILMALWLYATLEGVGSARALERLCQQHDAYRWVCGGVSVNYHSLADFRVAHGAFLDHQLTVGVATLMSEGLVSMKRVAQDGMRIRASAGAASFRRQPSLESALEEARVQVEALRQELQDDPAGSAQRERAARLRAAEEREQRVRQALEHLPQVEAKKKAAEKVKARVSTTDPEARVMKMADGGFRPAFNGQFCTDTETQVVVGVDLSNEGSDQGELMPMLEQLTERYQVLPEEVLVDGEAGHRSGHHRRHHGLRPGPKAQRLQPRPPHPAARRQSCHWRVARTHGHRTGQGHLQAASLDRRVRQCYREKPRTAPIHRAWTAEGQKRVAVVRAWPQSDARSLPAPAAGFSATIQYGIALEPKGLAPPRGRLATHPHAARRASAGLDPPNKSHITTR